MFGHDWTIGVLLIEFYAEGIGIHAHTAHFSVNLLLFNYLNPCNSCAKNDSFPCTATNLAVFTIHPSGERRKTCNELRHKEFKTV